jgi:hypothetical protein
MGLLRKYGRKRFVCQSIFEIAVQVTRSSPPAGKFHRPKTNTTQRGFAQLLQNDSVTEPYRPEYGQVSILDSPFYTHLKYMN